MSAAGLQYIRKVMTELKQQGVKPSIAADIWSDTSVSLLGVMLYYIDDKWEGLHEILLGCNGFSGLRHTGVAIKKQTETDLENVGLTFEDIHAKVSDQGSNIKKAWGGLPGGYCTAHTLELCVKEFLDAPGIMEVVKKAKGMTAYYHRSSSRLADLQAIQQKEGLPETQPPVTGNSVRWHYTHDSMDWFRVNKRAVQIYDISHGTLEKNDDGPYGESHMDHADWILNLHSVIVLHPAAHGVKILEGTKYVTVSLVMPLFHKLIDVLRNPELVPNWDAGNPISLAHQTPELRAAKKSYIQALIKRFIDELPLETKAQYAISTLLDPRFKKYSFSSPDEQVWAESELRKEWAKWSVQVSRPLSAGQEVNHGSHSSEKNVSDNFFNFFPFS